MTPQRFAPLLTARLADVQHRCAVLLALRRAAVARGSAQRAVDAAAQVDARGGGGR